MWGYKVSIKISLRETTTHNLMVLTRTTNCGMSVLGIPLSLGFDLREQLDGLPTQGWSQKLLTRPPPFKLTFRKANTSIRDVYDPMKEERLKV